MEFALFRGFGPCRLFFFPSPFSVLVVPLLGSRFFFLYFPRSFSRRKRTRICSSISSSLIPRLRFCALLFAPKSLDVFFCVCVCVCVCVFLLSLYFFLGNLRVFPHFQSIAVETTPCWSWPRIKRLERWQRRVHTHTHTSIVHIFCAASWRPVSVCVCSCVPPFHRYFLQQQQQQQRQAVGFSRHGKTQ